MTRLDAESVRRHLATEVATALDSIAVFKSIDSTNAYLKKQPSPARGRFRLAVAEHQTAGRGRHNRTWVSSPGSSLCLSMSYRFVAMPANLSPLTLALGIDLAHTLNALGVDGVRLKWPNDLLIGDAKLGGILTEALFRGETDVTVIAGVGLNRNFDMPLDPADMSDWANAATSLADVMPVVPPEDQLAASVAMSFAETFAHFERAGFAPFATRFGELDWLQGRDVDIETAEGDISGTAMGICDDGALLVHGGSGPSRIYAGSVRRAEAPAATT